jgi:hypothetical protein
LAAPSAFAATDLQRHPLMLAGHYGIGLALKARYPRVALIPLLVACVLPDLLWLAFHAMGWERLTSQPSSYWRPDTFGPMPFSHDLSMAILYAGIIGGMGLLTVSQEWSVALGVAIVSHVLLDALVHAADISVAGPWLRASVGLDLWRRAPFAAWMLEAAIVAAGAGFYIHRSLPQARRRAVIVGAALGAFHLAALVPL